MFHKKPSATEIQSALVQFKFSKWWVFSVTYTLPSSSEKGGLGKREQLILILPKTHSKHFPNTKES